MPRVVKDSKVYKRVEKTVVLWGVIEKYMSIKKITPVELAKRINVGQATIYNWRKVPSKITMANLLLIADVLGIPEIEVAEALIGKRVRLDEAV